MSEPDALTMLREGLASQYDRIAAGLADTRALATGRDPYAEGVRDALQSVIEMMQDIAAGIRTGQPPGDEPPTLRVVS
jgi:hypothetical protein